MSPRLANSKDHFSNDDQFEYLLPGVGGIMLAGALFSFLAFTLGGTIEAYFNGGNLPQFWQGLWIFVVGFLVCGSIGAIIFLTTGMLSVFFVGIVNMSLGYPLDHRTAAVTTGSLAGFVPTAFLLFTEDWMFFGFTFIAMALCAMGASWTAGNHLTDLWRPLVRETKYKLSIKRMMIATAWLAGLFATANITGSPAIAIAASIWILLNAVLIGIAKLYRMVRPLATSDPLLN